MQFRENIYVMKNLLVLVLFALLSLYSTSPSYASETVVESTYSCDDCKFFPSVCDNIDNCIDNCNIAPTMRSSCNELVANANRRTSANEDL